MLLASDYALSADPINTDAPILSLPPLSVQGGTLSVHYDGGFVVPTTIFARRFGAWAAVGSGWIKYNGHWVRFHG